jgi:FAD/FMN-containing dehydrogenase
MDDAQILAAFVTACGADGVLSDTQERRFHAGDVYAEGATPLCVIRPTSIAALSQALAIAHGAGLAIHPRGGGMSYTDAYLPQTERAIVVDTSGLDQIVAIDARGLFCTAQAGVTWAALDAALAPHGVRARFWGPMSGYTATIGGGVSHGAITYGSGNVGAAGSAVLGLTVVLADGRILRTGMDAQAGAAPFLRGYGPDLTGLFCHDGGALGVKAEITLALEPRPKATDGVSFLFDDFAAMTACVEAIARAGLASEVVATDADVMRLGVATRTLNEDLATGWRIFRAAPDPFTGLARLARVAAGGRRFFERAAYAAHFVVEGESAAEIRLKLEQVRARAGAGAHETSNAMPLFLRAAPFNPLPVTSADGRRLLALNAILPFSALEALHRHVQALLAAHKPALEAAGGTVMFVFTTLGRNAFLYEPFFYWKDSLSLVHQRRTPDAMRASWPEHPDNPQARALVEAMKAKFVALFRKHGAAHVQIGRVYPWAADREPENLALMREIKGLVDPSNRMNPGVLGLAPLEREA